jgi:hypothetical protein
MVNTVKAIPSSECLQKPGAIWGLFLHVGFKMLLLMLNKVNLTI